MRKSSLVRPGTDNYNDVNLCLVNFGPRSNPMRVADRFFRTVVAQPTLRIGPQQTHTLLNERIYACPRTRGPLCE